MTSEPSLWRASCRESLDAPPLDTDRDVDLAVIGGGYTGCSAALEAARAGASVCLLEAETIGHGGSGRNVGLVNAGLWLPPDAIRARLGQAAGQRLIAALAEAPAGVFQRIEAFGIDCDPVRAGTLHCAHAASGLRDLQSRYRQGQAAGAPVRLLDRAETRRRTGAAGLHGALFDPRAGTVQPLAYCRGLARAAQASGAVLCQHSPVSALRHDGGAWHISAAGHDLRARAVLLATNAYHGGFAAPFRPRFVTVNFSQFATEPLSGADRTGLLEGGEGCWDTATVMTSFRIDASGRLIVGGMGRAEGAGRQIHAAWARRKLARLYPDLKAKAFAHHWTGRIAMTSDHVPRIVEFGPNAMACFGYSGRGIAPGTLFGASAALALLSGDTGDLPLHPVRQHAEPFAGLRGTYYEFGATAMHLVAARRSV